MPARITKKVLEKMTDQLNVKEGRPRTAYTMKTDEEIANQPAWESHARSNAGHVYLDYATHYGGYALREILDRGEDFYWPRWTRVSGREMYAYLEGKLSE